MRRLGILGVCIGLSTFWTGITCASQNIPTIRSLVEVGSYSEARQLLQNLIKAHPNDPTLRIEAAHLYQRIGLSSLALQEFEQAIAIDPKSSEAFSGLAQICLANLDQTKAIEYASRALALKPDSLAARLTLVSALIDLRRLRDADNEIKPLLCGKFSPLSPEVAYLAFQLNRERKQLKYAKRYLDEALSQNPNKFQWLLDKADLCQAMGDYLGARRNLERVIVMNPGSLEALNKLAMALEFDFHDYDGAITQYQKVLAIDPDYITANVAIERCKDKKNDLAGILKSRFWQEMEQLQGTLFPSRNSY